MRLHVEVGCSHAGFLIVRSFDYVYRKKEEKPKEEKPKKEEKKKEEKPKDDDDDDEDAAPVEKKNPNPLDLLPPSLVAIRRLFVHFGIAILIRPLPTMQAVQVG